MKKETLEQIALCFMKFYGVRIVKKDVKVRETFEGGGCLFTLNGIGWYYSSLCFTVDRSPCIDEEPEEFYMDTILRHRV